MKRLLFLCMFMNVLCIECDLYKNVEHGPILQAYFTESDNVTELLIKLINQEKKSLIIAIFYLSDNRVINALIEAKKRGVRIAIVIDKNCINAVNFKNLNRLALNHIDITVFTNKHDQLKDGSGPLMHNKYCIFGMNASNKPLVWTGSFNFTYAAQKSNKENIIILDNKAIIEQFNNNFLILKQQTKPLTETKEFKRLKQKQLKKYKKKKKRIIQHVKIYIKQ